ncbi:right-handed parallel beta-helix repeat-containing protein [Edaphobacter sp. HDX4]|uniref:right-handed parallel beta-helix repeat-containing protein n=1 Tax=Edaphobacter sp. HDX4 TaxID=2794064 RepID=UPI002FE51F1E
MRVVSLKLSAVLVLTLVASAANAQATRTWVSGVGDDANPCSRTAPCKTFAGAISKTAAGGEISVLDPGGFGTVTIAKALTINGEASLGGVLNSYVDGVVVAAGSSDVVVLKHLSINGSGTGLSGVRYISAGQVIVEDSFITGETVNGIVVASTGNANLVVRNTNLNGGAAGIMVNPTSSPVNVSLSKVSITGFANGVYAQSGNVDISDSVVTQNSGTGLLASGGTITALNDLLTGNGTAVQASGSGIANIDKSTISGNGVAIQAQTGSTIRISNNSIYNNMTGVTCGGTVVSAGDNRKGSNVGGSAAVCAPTATISLQ